MRDDLHKGAPVPQRFRKLIRTCTRNTPDRYERAIEHARDAIVADARAELRPSFLARLFQAAAPTQLSLGVGLPVEVELQGLRPTPLESRVLEHHKRVAAEGGVGRPAAEQALRDALCERKDARTRQIDGHVAVEAPNDRPEAMLHIRSAVDRVDLDEVCSTLVKGDRPAAPPKQAPLDIDEDIR